MLLGKDLNYSVVKTGLRVLNSRKFWKQRRGIEMSIHEVLEKKTKERVKKLFCVLELIARYVHL